MKKLKILVPLVIVATCMTACASLTQEKTVATCYSTYTALNQSIALGYNTTITLSKQEYLDDNKVQTIIGYLDLASYKADNASALCQMDLDAAFNVLDEVKVLINKTSVDTGENNE